MKIYTKTGDKGETSLYTGERVPKYSLNVDLYGRVDELNSFLGMLISESTGDSEKLKDKEFLTKIQKNLFVMGSWLASSPEGRRKIDLPLWPKNAEKELELKIDEMEKELPELRSFILPGGGKLSSFGHICRVNARALERAMVRYKETDEHENIDHFIIYLNRLSDFFFSFSRLANLREGKKEDIWP